MQSMWVNDELPKDRDVAMVFQNYGLYPHMSVYENIRYPPESPQGAQKRTRRAGTPRGRKSAAGTTLGPPPP